MAVNSIGIEGATALAGALEKNETLITLDISNNEFGNDSVIKIAKALTTKTNLKKLYIRGNTSDNIDYKISNFGATAIADLLKINESLIELDIANNIITKNGFEKIKAALKNNTKSKLNTLYMSNYDGITDNIVEDFQRTFEGRIVVK